ncbi:MAG: Na/Pi cotransporter family protein [Bacteroidales bacterium]|nr:Na/Pi cotransporter family protein [Bacteroidales bacterium]
MSIFAIFKLLGCLALLMFGMKTMSEALQKLTGDKLRKILGAMTTNSFTGLLTGALVTATIQSSTATTVMVVSFVNAGLLTLAQAISVIMGANIGTTVTAWLMSIFGFQINLGDYVFCLFAIAIPFFFSKKGDKKSFGEFLFGFSFMFLGLLTLRQTGSDMHLETNPAILSFIDHCKNWGDLSILMFLLIGGFLTMCIQSSAAVMAITMILCSAHPESLDLGIALVMGENIGTTVTSNIAALTGNSQARRAALSHLMFNMFGVFWVLCVFHPFISLDKYLVNLIAPNVDEHIKVTFYLSAFHTMFNVCNVLILIWFIKPFERIVCQLIKEKEEDEDFRLRYISSGMLSTAELSILQAHKEIILFSQRIQRMFGMVRSLLQTTKDEEFAKLFSRIEKYENISDHMEIEIADYLNHVSEGRLSSTSKLAIRGMLREVTEIESIGDSCYNLARTISRKKQSNTDFTEQQYEHIHFMMKLDEDALNQMLVILEKGDQQELEINKTYNIENEINNYRNQLKTQNILDVNNKQYDYQMGVYYMDIISECEKLGDYTLNVVEASVDVKDKNYSNNYH